MLLKLLLTITSSSLFVAAWTHANSTANAVPPITAFNLTAISAVNGVSVLECWQITLPLTISSTTGIQGAVIQQLGDVSSMVWSSLPGGYVGPPHPAPSVQYVYFLYCPRSLCSLFDSQVTLLTTIRA